VDVKMPSSRIVSKAEAADADADADVAAMVGRTGPYSLLIYEQMKWNMNPHCAYRTLYCRRPPPLRLRWCHGLVLLLG